MNWKSKESLVVEEICKDISILANSLDIFLSSAFLGKNDHPFGQDTLILKEVPREELGLVASHKPGDIDLLLVPYNGAPMLDKSIAIEVKVVRPTIEKPGKSPSKLGVTQARGLLKDGFPYVGLLHVCIPEPLPTEMHLNIPMKGWNVDEFGNMEDLGYDVLWDPFPTISADRQLGRLLATVVPESIAYRVIGLVTDPGNDKIRGCTSGQPRIGYRNMGLSEALLEGIDTYLRSNQDACQHVEWT